jgi:SAM-dependent methyltransferase
MRVSSAKSALARVARAVGYDKTHITRVVAYRAIDDFFDTLPCDQLDALEISAGWKWRDRNWGSFTEMNWPEHDICDGPLMRDSQVRQFDVVIADNVWEHLKYPARSARSVFAMLKPGGYFINITPFLIRHHPIPLDCSRWTETGMRHFLEEAGFDPDAVTTGSWGNAGAVRANFHRWARAGWRRRWPNDPDFPITVWAIAKKAA